MFADGTVNAECDAFEPPETADDGKAADTECNPFVLLGKSAGREYEVVDHMCEHQDRKIQGRQLKVITGS